jgi:hypothetical protein
MRKYLPNKEDLISLALAAIVCCMLIALDKAGVIILI